MDYFRHAFEGCKPFFAFLMSSTMYVMFPEKAYITAFYAVVGTMLLDILTKYYAIARQYGGLWKSVKERHIHSNKMWNGTKNKIFSYLIIFILAGLSYRVAPATGVSVFLATTIYSVLFLRETQSILENLVDAGNDVGWLLMFVKNKQIEVLKDEIDSTEKN